MCIAKEPRIDQYIIKERICVNKEFNLKRCYISVNVTFLYYLTRTLKVENVVHEEEVIVVVVVEDKENL